MNDNPITVTNSGSLTGVSIGGAGNTSIGFSGAGDSAALATELRQVLAHLQVLSLSAETEGDRELLQEALRHADAGDTNRARSVLLKVGAWVATVAGSISAMLVKDMISS